MKLFAGIDAGQSGTVAVIGDESGQVLGRGEAGPADEIGEAAQSTRLHDALRDAYGEAARAAGLSADSCCARVVAGVSGYEGRVYGRAPELPADELVLLHDAIIAHAGAFAGEAGIIVIAGTGTVAHGVNARGERATVGGWGYLFGDEGGAFWLVRDAIAAAIHDEDDGKVNALGAQALRYFNKPALHALARSFYAGEITRARFASFSQTVIEFEPTYGAKAARALIELAKQTMAKLGMNAAPVAFLGGVARNPAIRAAIAQSLPELAPGARQVEPRHEAAVGALLLAIKGHGR